MQSKDAPAATLPCHDNSDLFYSEIDDGRSEEGREDRETLATVLCWGCPIRLGCLEQALVLKELYGVWGGMGEGERRRFRLHLNAEGYDRNEVPTGPELVASLNAYYRRELTPHEAIAS